MQDFLALFFGILLGPRECVSGTTNQPVKPGIESTTTTITTTSLSGNVSNKSPSGSSTTTPPKNYDNILVLPLPDADRVQEMPDHFMSKWSGQKLHYQHQHKKRRKPWKHSSSETFTVKPGVNPIKLKMLKNYRTSFTFS